MRAVNTVGGTTGGLHRVRVWAISRVNLRFGRHITPESACPLRSESAKECVMARKKKPGPKPAALSESGKAMLDAIRNCPTPHRLYGLDTVGGRYNHRYSGGE